MLETRIFVGGVVNGKDGRHVRSRNWPVRCWIVNPGAVENQGGHACGRSAPGPNSLFVSVLRTCIPFDGENGLY